MIYLLRQVCHSLAEAGSYGLVHRDIKPANLFVCRYGGEHDFVKVLDFGIAKAADHMMETGAIGLTRDHGLRGTPAYIAPEQALGASAVDSRADIYAAGCVAYFLLTGHLVFTGDTPMAVVVHHAHTPPTPPSERSEMPIPPALDRLVMACLAKSPADRPQSAKALSLRLGEIGGASRGPTSARGTGGKRTSPSRIVIHEATVSVLQEIRSSIEFSPDLLIFCLS